MYVTNRLALKLTKGISSGRKKTIPDGNRKEQRAKESVNIKYKWIGLHKIVTVLPSDRKLQQRSSGVCLQSEPSLRPGTILCPLPFPAR